MIDNSQHMIGLYIAVNLLLNLVLAYRVSSVRQKINIMTGTGEHDQLYKTSRAHTVNTEYAPIGLIGLLGLFVLAASVWVIHAAGVALTLGRLLHAIGLSRSVDSSQPRLWGTLLTWIGQLIAALGCLYYAFS